MTPLEGVEELRKLAEIELQSRGLPVPERTWAQLGPLVIECSALVATATNAISQEMAGQQCDFGQVATYTVAIARDCPDVFLEDGSTNIPNQTAASEQQDDDGDALWAAAQTWSPFLTKTWAVDWSITGNLAITTLTLTTGVE